MEQLVHELRALVRRLVREEGRRLLRGRNAAHGVEVNLRTAMRFTTDYTDATDEED
jgi:hypothetical protein